MKTIIKLSLKITALIAMVGVLNGCVAIAAGSIAGAYALHKHYKLEKR